MKISVNTASASNESTPTEFINAVVSAGYLNGARQDMDKGAARANECAAQPADEPVAAHQIKREHQTKLRRRTQQNSLETSVIPAILRQPRVRNARDN